MREFDLLTVLATLGLGVALVLSTTFAFYAAQTTQRASQRADLAQKLNAYYQNASVAVTLEESLERKYRLEPSPRVEQQHERAAQSLTQALAAVEQLVPPAKASAIGRLLKEHAAYLYETQQLFEAVDAGDNARAFKLDQQAADPKFADLSKSVQALAAEQRATAASAFTDLARIQRDVVQASIAFSLLGLFCLCAFLFVLRAYRRRLWENHQAEIRVLEEVASIDALTKIGNHRRFKEDIQREVELAIDQHSPLTLALLDVDEFKVINDENGHVHGDEILVALARVLRAGRATDRPYRVGGDEFALILPHTSAARARPVLERLRSSATNALEGGTVSIGYASLGPGDGSAENLQNQADAALYAIKRSGRNGVSEYNPTGEASWLLSTERVRELRSILAENQVGIMFQPIWDLASAEIVAYEALARFPAVSGFAGPQDAFDLAERVGRAHELDALCRKAALARVQDLPPGIPLFLNVSPQTLDRDFDVGTLRAAVREAGLTPDRIVIEITERSTAHVDAVIGSAKALQRAGFRLALDDTGAGHAGLEILSRVHFDFVKIDREIIVKAMSDPNARGVLSAIAAFAQVTGAYVIAEGIEDRAMLDFVECAEHSRVPAGRGIAGAQGFLLSQPTEAFPTAGTTREVQALLRDHLRANGAPAPASGSSLAGSLREA